MTFDEWVQYGISKQWVLPPVCLSHDGTPLSEEETEMIDYGDDPCINAMRVCEPEHWQQIYDNTTAMKWRHENCETKKETEQ